MSESQPTVRGVTIVVPAFDEERGIEGVVARLLALDLGRPTELVVVDDGSRDGTAVKLDALAKAEPRIHAVRHARNQGYGAALKTGIARAKYDVVVITDADGTYPEDRIVDLLAAVDDGADMAVGARTGADVNIPLIRRPAKAVLRWIAAYLAATPIPDLNSGMRAMRKDLVLRYRSVLPQGFSFTTTITLASLTNDHRVDYIPIDYAAREGRSKIRPIRDTLGFLALILRTVLYFNPLRIFYPVALVVGLLFCGSFLYDMFLVEPGPNLGDKTVLLFVALVQTLSLGLVADLIDKKSRLGS
ncbi:MAG: glycosyltransferase family 2 protein [Planctomycetota bacterium]